MKKKDKTKDQLIKALQKLHHQAAELEKSKAEGRFMIERLKETEEKYKTVFESANDIILLVDNKGKILDVSKKVSKLSGYTRKELIGKNIRTLTGKTSEKDFEILIKNFKKRMAGIATPSFELAFVKKNGRLAHIEINAIALKKKTKIIGDLSIIRDITERKQAEEATNQKTEDLLLISSLNNALNRGADFHEIISLLSREIKKIFSCDGVAIYLPSQDLKYLVVQKNDIIASRTRQVEELFGIRIPFEIKTPMRKGSLYYAILQKGKPQLINDPKKIQHLISEFTENNTLKKLVPKIYKLLKIRSVINIPLIYGSNAISLMDMGREKPFTESELKRLEIITEHVTSILKHFQAVAIMGENEKQYRTLFEKSPTSITLLDNSGVIIDCNKATEKLTGYAKGELVGKPFDQLLTLNIEDLPKVKKLYKMLSKRRELEPVELEIIRKGGERRRINIVSSSLVRDDTVVGFQVIASDITEHKQADEALRTSEEKYKTLTENINVGIYRNTVGPKGEFIEANPAIVKMFGYNSREDFFKLKVADLYQNPGNRKRFNKKMLRDGFVRNEELKLRKKDGTLFTGSVSAVAVKDEKGEVKYYDGMIEDATDRKLHEQELWYMANHDVLTGLPNRMLFHDRLTMAIMHAQRKRQKLVVMLLDLDHFKDINDTLGHNVGDQLLKYVGDRLTNILRRGDTVARMGGDEFMLLLPDLVQIEDAAKIAQKFLEAIREPFKFDGYNLNITTSIGVAIYPNDGEDADGLMKNADIAMYRAKEKGRNTYRHFTPP